ncbi:MAG: phosphoglucosamine mutase [Bifidobacteriaceae bacterium]|jgi:phosphoglucosamine mutase|nr:phosphoglucosamine mutase [Bifidobacteriaceae bacterium]
MARLFGTDGVRGLANRVLNAELVLKLSQAAAIVLTQKNTKRQRALVGRDTRLSGEFLSAATAAGLASAGIDVIDVGVITTPGVAYLTSKLNVDMGVVLSASHNPYYDNGIKFIDKSGFKLADTLEDKIAKQLQRPANLPINDQIGKISFDSNKGVENYIEHLLACASSLDVHPLKGLKIVVDPGNGAASAVAPTALRQAGAEVITINDSPDGLNINFESGSTHPEAMQAVTKAARADMGVAFDGDADRCIACDSEGNLVNGDQIMGILALSKKGRGTLKNDTLVLTVMSNLGLLQALDKFQIKYVITQVGDRYVLEKMLADGFNLGGEQSGHIINLDYSTTGDGILSALMLARELNLQKKSLAQLADPFPQLPQVLINISDVDKSAIDSNKNVQIKLKQVQDWLSDSGRILLRPSGTEPLVRVMVEAPTYEQAKASAETMAQTIKKELGSRN